MRQRTGPGPARELVQRDCAGKRRLARAGFAVCVSGETGRPGVAYFHVYGWPPRRRVADGVVGGWSTDRKVFRGLLML